MLRGEQAGRGRGREGAESGGRRGRGPGSDGRLSATGDFWSPRSQRCGCCGRRAHRPEAMENGAVYSPTTEEDPGPARGPRSGLAAYFFLDRLPGPRRVLKGLQLVSPRSGRASPGRGAGSGLGLGGRRAASFQLGCSVRGGFHTSSSFPLRLGRGALPSALPPGGPQSHGAPHRDPTSWGHPVLGGLRKCVGDPSQSLQHLSLILCGDFPLFSLLLLCIIAHSACI